MSVEGEVPAGLRIRGGGNEDVCFRYLDGQECRLTIRPYIVGIGCKKGKSGAELFGFFRQICRQYEIDERRICWI